MAINIKEVKTNTELTQFITFPDKLYKGNEFRVPQLHSFEKSTLKKGKNPAFDYCKARYWLAFKDKKIVGRIAGILNNKSNEIWNEKYIRFGWIDFIDDLEVSKALLATVEAWAKELNIQAIHGPLGFTDMDLEGMLVEGFDELGTQAVIYNYPYYPVHLEKLGYTKDTDWVQLKIKIPEQVPERIKRISKLVQEKYGLKLLTLKTGKEVRPYAKSMFDTLNAAFKNLYGFVPLTDKQITYYTDQYFSMVNPKYLGFVVDKDEQVVAFGLAFSSLSKALIKAKGKLFPLGILHILKAMKKNDTVDLLLQAVRPEYQDKGVAAIFFEHMAHAFIEDGIKTAITSHALENNKAAIQIFKPFDSRQHLRRRIYIKAIS